MYRNLLAGIALGACVASAHASFSDDVIKLGVLNDRSGLYADLAGEGSVIAARMAIEEFGGKVGGVPVEVIAADHLNRADLAANIARQWLDEDSVDVVLDGINSAAALAIQGITEEREKIFIASGPATTELTGKSCSATGFHWTYDTNALAMGTARAIVESGKKRWFFLTADYTFGDVLQATTTNIIEELGGEVLGSVRHPLNTADFSSFLLQAQSSGADVIGLANASGDTANSIMQAAEFGITQAGQSLAGMLMFITDIHALGLESAQGLMLTTAFYWDMDEQTRAWSAEFEKRAGRKPTMVQAGVYSSVLHYLKAVEKAGTDDGPAVAKAMREMPVSDMFARNGYIADNGLMMHDMYLVRVKAPEESTTEWDYYDIVATMSGENAFLDPAESGCHLVR